MPIFINEFGGPDVYGWGDGVGDACGANGEAAMYGGTNTPEPCSPVDYTHTHHTETHSAADELYGGAVAELDLVRVSWLGPATAKY